MNLTSETTQKTRLPQGLVAGSVLILIGVSALLQNIVNFEFAFLPLLAVIFIAAGLLTRRSGLLVPGGVLAGVGLGAALVEGNYFAQTEMARGGLFFFCLAGGFLLISLLSTITEGLSNFMRWPLFPAAGLTLFGTALLAGEAGLITLQMVSYLFPVVLIALGLLLIVRRK